MWNLKNKTNEQTEKDSQRTNWWLPEWREVGELNEIGEGD